MTQPTWYRKYWRPWGIAIGYHDEGFLELRLACVRFIGTSRMAGLHSSALYASNTTIPRKTPTFFGPAAGLYFWPLS